MASQVRSLEVRWMSSVVSLGLISMSSASAARGVNVASSAASGPRTT